ncbi:GIY-YIG nuclease family protein [[Eubacterium] cellulosolvens]
MKGSYVLVIELPRSKSIPIGKLGYIKFSKGYYAYIGSALNGLEARLRRHIRKDKKLFWHIDYLLTHAKIIGIYYKPSTKKEECALARDFATTMPEIRNFGASDCNCRSHLFYSGKISDLQELVSNFGMQDANCIL